MDIMVSNYRQFYSFPCNRQHPFFYSGISMPRVSEGVDMCVAADPSFRWYFAVDHECFLDLITWFKIYIKGINSILIPPTSINDILSGWEAKCGFSIPGIDKTRTYGQNST